MNAQEMFEKLGWKRFENDYTIDYGFNYDREYEQGMLIAFYKRDKVYLPEAIGRHYDMYISLELHQAITQQMVELGWMKGEQ